MGWKFVDDAHLIRAQGDQTLGVALVKGVYTWFMAAITSVWSDATNVVVVKRATASVITVIGIRFFSFGFGLPSIKAELWKKGEQNLTRTRSAIEGVRKSVHAAK